MSFASGDKEYNWHHLFNLYIFRMVYAMMADADFFALHSDGDREKSTQTLTTFVKPKMLMSLEKMRKQTKSSHRFRKHFVLDKWHRDRVGFHHMCIASVQIYLHFNSLQKARNHIQLSYILIYSFIGTRCYSFP